ncbi:MAG: ABC transporter substrate-binding protein [Aeromonas sp.]
MKKGLSKIALALMAAGMAFNVAAADLKVAVASDATSLDPQEVLSGQTLEMSHLAFDPLIRWTKDLQFEPRLAEKYTRIDDNTMRFFLRKGVKFHSGNEMTADDVIWTIQRLKGSVDFKAMFEPIVEVKKIDDYTVDFITAKPYPLMLQTVTYIFPMDAKFYQNNGKDKGEIVKNGSSFASTNVSGTGPFSIKSREQGVRTEYVRNPNYWDKASKGNVDNLTVLPIKEDATRVAALLGGDVDMVYPVAPNDLERVKNGKNTQLVTLSGTRAIILNLNQNTNPALKDQRVRQAINYAINQEGIVQKINKGFGTPAGQLSPKGYAGYNPALTPQYDLSKAKALMKDAGFEQGFKMTFIAPAARYVNDVKIAQAVSAMLAKINIKVDLKTMPVAQYWPEFDKCAADIQMIGWHADTEDSANFFEFLTFTKDAKTGMGQYNCGGYANAKADAMVMAANSETDPAKRATMLQEVEAMLAEDAAFVPLHWEDLAYGAQKQLDIEPVVNVMNFPYLGDLVVTK